MSECRHMARRTCLGCGTVDAQTTLLRIVRTADGSLQLDANRRAGGRGGYLHPRAECWARFAHRKGPVRSLRVTIDRPTRAALVAALQSAGIE